MPWHNFAQCREDGCKCGLTCLNSHDKRAGETRIIMENKMPHFLKLITLASFVAIGSTAMAQDSETPKPQDDATATTAEATDTTADSTATADETLATEEAPVVAGEEAAGETPEGLSMGEEVVDENGPGTTYIVERFEAWELRCVRVEEGQKEPCHLFQLMLDKEDNPIAEMNFVTLANGGQAVAGGTIVAPLETLLTKQVTLSVDTGAKKRYPFRFCSPIGCYAQIGFSNGDVSSFKRGNEASLTIIPAFAPDEKITVKLSLAGFTKAYDALKAKD